ncbi:MAG TPA: universal stress protein [Candidatus Nitrosotalea sp.]|nr:universal stress protein [Candidatus Nitrosotalea sp.]
MTTAATVPTKTPGLPLENRITLKNILYATDFSPAAENALKYAGALAKSFGAKLYALHVQEPANYALPPELWRGAEQAREEQMKELRNTMIRAFPGVLSETIIGEGGLWPAIALAAEKYAVDFIVLGTRGRTGFGKLMLGSQAEEILRRAEIPVLAVGPGVHPEMWPSGKFASILFATDFGPASQTAMRYALSFAEENQAKLTLLHVVDLRKEEKLVSRVEDIEGPEKKLRAMVPEEAKAWCTPKYLVYLGDPVEKILKTAEEMGADLIVLGVHRADGVPGAATHLPIATVHKLLAQAVTPVLTVRG